MTMTLVLLLILSGGAVGSFLALVADRLPQNEDFVSLASHCRACRAPIAWRDKLPVLSYLMLGGKCRGCGAPIPKHLFYSEAAGMVLASFAVLAAASPLHMLLGALLLWCLMGLALCDLRALRLPDFLTLLLFLIGLGLAVEDPARNLPDGFIGAAAGAGSFWIIRVGYKALRRREGLGLGDVKLMAGIGAALGFAALPVTALVAAITALLASLALGKVTASTAIPFGAYLSGAAGIVWLAGIFW